MEKLSMCRICLSSGPRLRSIVETHLQEIYESLTLMLLVTEDIRPSLACDLCCSKLETCYELKTTSRRSEDFFKELLTHEIQVKLEVMPDEHLSMEDVTQSTADVLDSDDVKQEHAEDSTAVEQDQEHLYHNAWCLNTECALPMNNLKEESDFDDGAPVCEKPGLTTQMNYEDTPANNFIGSDHEQTMDNIEEPKSETKRTVLGKPVERNKIVQTREKNDTRLSNNKQNDSEYDLNDSRIELVENKISADQSIYIVNSSSRYKLKHLLCDTCHKCFRYKSSLIVHIRTHTGKKPFKCNVCKKCFTQNSTLNAHILTHSGEKPYQCNVCKKCFSRKGNLDIHTRTHTGQRPYQCNVCKKCFSLKCSLDRHTRSHTGEKPYQCNVCKKCYSEKRNLDGHIRTHTGEKPYQCNVCKECFSKKAHLNIHIRTHTGEKPYQCNVCKKCFIQKGGLIRHTRTHTGEKPYQCNVCMKSFIEKCKLDSHTRTHTGEKP